MTGELNNVGELVYDVLRNGLLQYGWSVPRDVLRQVSQQVSEAIGNAETVDGEFEEVLDNHEERIQGLELMAVDLNGHSERLLALERAVRGLSRPTRLRRSKDAKEVVEEPQGSYEDFKAETLDESRSNDSFGSAASLPVLKLVSEQLIEGLPDDFTPVLTTRTDTED